MNWDHRFLKFFLKYKHLLLSLYNHLFQSNPKTLHGSMEFRFEANEILLK